MLITWDEKKEASNIKKHGVSFIEAASVLSNPTLLSNLNKHESGNRHEYLGFSINARLLYVVTVEERDDEIRIISARKATKREAKLYEKRI
jgi:uncharacterized DUF497 family protein